MNSAGIWHHLADSIWRMPIFVKVMLASAVYAAVQKAYIRRKQVRMAEEARAWPTMRGRVVAAQAIASDKNDSRNSSWTGLVTYSYIADEVEIGEYREFFRSEEDVDEWVRYLRDRVLTIHVDPRDRRRSCWAPDEVEAAKAATRKESAEFRAEPLAWWQETLRLVVMVVSLVSGVILIAVEFKDMFFADAQALQANKGITYGLRAAAFVCFAVAAAIFKKRFPRRSMENVAESLRDPFVKKVMRVLGVAEGLLALEFWMRSGIDDLAGNRVGDVVVSMLCLGAYVVAAGMCWLAGQRGQARHELAPER